ncbi:MAG TPA: spermidine/putrescine ABC transporter substrate-binding protein [Streptosporangiaceae bacterium]|nr:spermidine/putrescine ABC transporter substrate-binding protein [Streptosporangiaceae bacterium]
MTSGRRYRRRDVLQLGLAAAGLGLAGCSGTPSGGQRAVSAFWRHQRKLDSLSFANWPIYIDPDRRTLTEFADSTGIAVRYAEVIKDPEAFFALVEPALQAGKPTGYDIMVLTNGFVFSELEALGQLVPLDQAMLGNFYKYASARFRHRSYDPGNLYSVPWASGTTGIAWNPRYITSPVTSIDALWDATYKGRVGMLVDVSDTGSFGMLKRGIDPQTSTPEDWRQAAEVLLQQRDSGLVRSYYDQSYIDALADGETWISMAWSGDIFQQNQAHGTNLEFAIPAEGGMIWTDNMLIPKYAGNPAGAMMLMDWYYRPEVAAMLTAGIGYISAVPVARALIAARAADATGQAKRALTEVAASPLVWPTTAEYNRLYQYPNVYGQAKLEYQAIFQPLVAM